MNNIKSTLNILIYMIFYISISSILTGCSEEKIIKKSECKSSKSANKIIIVDGRKKLIYDPSADKECLNRN